MNEILWKLTQGKCALKNINYNSSLEQNLKTNNSP